MFLKTQVVMNRKHPLKVGFIQSPPICHETKYGIVRGRKTYFLEDMVGENEDVYDSEFMIDTRFQPDILYEKKERQQLIKKTLKQLPENQRLALTLVTYQELSYEEISEILNCSVGAVKSLIHRARQNMKKLLIKAGIGDSVNAKI